MPLDDDLIGTHATENQVNSLSARKTDKKAPIADVVADSIFKVLSASGSGAGGKSRIGCPKCY